MAYDPNAAQVELNKLLSDVNTTLGTHLKFVSVDDLVRAVDDPRGTTSSLVEQVDRTPDQQIANIAQMIASDPQKLAATVKVVEDDINASPNLKAAFDEISGKVTPNEMLGLVSPLTDKLSVPVSSGGTLLGLIEQTLPLLPIRF
jgi:GAF domain-containing protein